MTKFWKTPNKMHVRAHPHDSDDETLSSLLMAQKLIAKCDWNRYYVPFEMKCVDRMCVSTNRFIANSFHSTETTWTHTNWAEIERTRKITRTSTKVDDGPREAQKQSLSKSTKPRAVGGRSCKPTSHHTPLTQAIATFTKQTINLILVNRLFHITLSVTTFLPFVPANHRVLSLLSLAPLLAPP